MLRRSFFGLFASIISFLHVKTFEDFEVLGMDYRKFAISNNVYDYYRDTCDLKLLLNQRVFSVFHRYNQKILVTIPGMSRVRYYGTPWLRYIQEGNIIYRENLEEFSFDVKKV